MSHVGFDSGIAAEFERIARTRHYKSGKTVLEQDDPVAFVGTVISGILRVQKALQDGRAQVVGLLLPSDMFGHAFERTSPVAIEAATDVTLCCYDRADFEELLTRFPQVQHLMLLSLTEELHAAQDWMLLLGCQIVTERVATFLLMLLKRGATLDKADRQTAVPRVNVPISRRDMAAYLGTTVESISRSLRELAEQGAIRILDAHDFEIADAALLARLSGREGEGGFDLLRRYKLAAGLK